jgi:hypothetical protein
MRSSSWGRGWGARGQQRQQLKWFALVAVLVLAEVAVTGLVPREQYPLALTVGFAILNWGIYAAIDIAGSATTCTTLTCCSWSASSASSPGRTDPVWPSRVPPWPWSPCSNPLRHRVQDAVDRRFNRHRYDAARTVEAFTRLRAQIDLDTLHEELLAVGDQTMEPTTVSLWLRPEKPS